jgi:peptidoglycan hydrolase-like protein with peptidoglycan-binding domain
MTERMSKLAMGLFMVFAMAVTGNLFLLQPSGTGGGPGAALMRTAALPQSVKHSPATEASPDDGQPVTSTPPGTPGPVTQQVSIAPPQANSRETVRAIQTALLARGYETGGNDGLAGPVTRAAILAYEADHGLPLTAEPSADFLEIVLLGSSAPRRTAGGALTPGPGAGQVIRSVQQSLAKLGYRAGKPDGRLGEDTIEAIRQFEKQEGLSDTGRISGELMARLTLLAGASRGAPAARAR